MFSIVKRDGSRSEFELEKISGAIVKAFDATQVQYNQDIIDLLVLRVTADMQGKVKAGGIQVEEKRSWSRLDTPKLPRHLFCTVSSVKRCVT